jgi:L-aspartate oxidase
VNRVIVIGSGLAGLWAALRAARRAPVVLITKAELQQGSTAWAQGGIAAAVGPGDSVTAHVADTLDAGAGLADPEAVRLICADGPGRIADLVASGVRFDGDPRGPALAREGAHSRPRVLHAGGDATGPRMQSVLAEAVRADPRIEVVEGERALEVLVRDGAVAGVLAAGRDGRPRRRAAPAVILATGGMGQLFSRTTNPVVATADGPALAYRAGAALADLEFVQFHPTALALGESPLALVSEAVRGEGAVLRDAHGRRFMPSVHPRAELGPRDVVARAIAARAEADGRDVTLDLRHLDADAVRARFPTVAALCRRHGLDLARDPIPVTPAAHYAMGGVLTDLWGRSTVPGLFAVGECACTGAHGANRLASNSLLEAVVMADRVARATAAEGPWPAGPAAPPRPARAVGGGDRRAELQAIMWRGAGVERDAGGLAAARRSLEALPDAADPEAANLQEVARLLVRAAELREESRGAHFRRDHPHPDTRLAARIAWVAGEPTPVPLGPQITIPEAA